MFLRTRAKDVDQGERALWGDLTSLGMVFPIAITAGFFLGRWAGGHLGHRAAGQYLGLAWGIAAAFRELWKTTKRMDRLDAARQAREGVDAPPPDGRPPREAGEGPHGA